jgi:hypothetical protein
MIAFELEPCLVSPVQLPTDPQPTEIFFYFLNLVLRTEEFVQEHW